MPAPAKPSTPCVPDSTSSTRVARAEPSRATLTCSGSPRGPLSGCGIVSRAAWASAAAAANLESAYGTVDEKNAAADMGKNSSRSGWPAALVRSPKKSAGGRAGLTVSQEGRASFVRAKTLRSELSQRILVVIAAGALCAACATAPERPAQIARIYRDTWGVPHIEAATEEAGFYALGYAQAQDRLPELLGSLLWVRGRLA